MTNAEWLINKKGITDFENLYAAGSGYNMYEILNEDGDVFGEQHWTGVDEPEVVLLHWLGEKHNDNGGAVKELKFEIPSHNRHLYVYLKEKKYINDFNDFTIKLEDIDSIRVTMP